MNPGMTQFTRTPALAHSVAAVNVRFDNPARAAPLCPIPGMPRAWSAPMLTMLPPRQTLIEGFARDQEIARQVVVNHRVPAVEAEILQLRGKLSTRRIDQTVDWTVLVQQVRDQPADRLFVSQLCAEASKHLSTVFADLVPRSL
jgi:hypothetical protein